MKVVKGNTLFITIAFIIFLFLFAYSFAQYINYVSNKLYSDAKNNIMETTLQSSIILQSKINADLNVVSTIAKAIEKNYYGNNNSTAYFLNNYVGEDKFIRFEFNDINGNCIICSGAQYKINKKQPSATDMKYADYVSKPFIDPITKDTIVSFNSPVIINGRVVGIVSGIKSLKGLYDSYTPTFYDGKGYSYIIDQSGALISPSFQSSNNYPSSNIFEFFSSHPRNEKALSQLKYDLLNKDKNVVNIFMNQDTNLVCYAPIEGINDWYVLMVIPSSVVSINTNKIIESTFSLSLLVFIILIMITTYIIIINKKNQNQIESLAFKDPLTGVNNLNKFKIEAARQLKKKSSGIKYALVQFDIDNFKYINDIFGFEEGNQTLKSIAKVLSESLSPNEHFARVANDVFVALLVYENDEKMFRRLNTIFYNICALQKKRINRYEIVLSFGIYRIKNKFMDISAMIDRANIAQKTVKGKHHTSFSFYNDEIRNKIIQEKEIENDMVSALKNKEFIFYLQPQYALKTKQIVGAEALARWKHPIKGLIYPSTFIPLFEKNNFVLQLDLYIFEQVCIKIKEWILRGYKPIPISVNMSRLHLHDANFIQKLKSIIEKYDVPANFIELELTESAFFDNVNILLDIIEKLRDIGFTISMDDFGSGYSSFNLLKDLPVDTLKLDREFFKDTTNTLRGQKVISGIISIAKELKMKVISEGVETFEQSEFLSKIDCDMAQGNYYAHPMPIENFEEIAMESGTFYKL